MSINPDLYKYWPKEFIEKYKEGYKAGRKEWLKLRAFSDLIEMRHKAHPLADKLAYSDASPGSTTWGLKDHLKNPTVQFYLRKLGKEFSKSYSDSFKEAKHDEKISAFYRGWNNALYDHAYDKIEKKFHPRENQKFGFNNYLKPYYDFAYNRVIKTINDYNNIYDHEGNLNAHKRTSSPLQFERFMENQQTETMKGLGLDKQLQGTVPTNSPVASSEQTQKSKRFSIA
jgi:hypothetical protein